MRCNLFEDFFKDLSPAFNFCSSFSMSCGKKRVLQNNFIILRGLISAMLNIHEVHQEHDRNSIKKLKRKSVLER